MYAYLRRILSLGSHKTPFLHGDGGRVSSFYAFLLLHPGGDGTLGRIKYAYLRCM